MKTNKIIARALVLLGFGGAVGLSTGCGANRAQKSRTSQGTSIDPDAPIMIMYGVSPSRYDRDRPIARRPSPIEEAYMGTIGGRVTDADTGEPVGYASVYLNRSDNGVLADMDGRYSIRAAIGDSLRFSMLGYPEQTVKVTGDTLDVRMKVDTVDLNDLNVIRVAYGPPYSEFRDAEAKEAREAARVSRKVARASRKAARARNRHNR